MASLMLRMSQRHASAQLINKTDNDAENKEKSSKEEQEEVEQEKEDEVMDDLENEEQEEEEIEIEEQENEEQEKEEQENEEHEEEIEEEEEEEEQENEEQDEEEQGDDENQEEVQPAPLDSCPLELSDREKELAQLLVSTPKLETDEYDWLTIAEQASDVLSNMIKLKSKLKTFIKAPTDTLVKYTRRKQFRLYMLSLQVDADDNDEVEEEVDEEVTADSVVIETPPLLTKITGTTLTSAGFADSDFSRLSDMDKTLAELMVNVPRLANGKYDWKKIHKQSPAELKTLIDTKSVYSKFVTQPIDYAISQSRRKHFRNYLTFLVGSPQGCKTVTKPKSDTKKSKLKDAVPILKIKIKRPPTSPIHVDSMKGTKKHKRGTSLEVGEEKKTSNTKTQRQLGELERELAELVELTPKLLEKGRPSYDWGEIERRASPKLKKRFGSKRHMISYQKWPLHVMVADPFKTAFREYREQLRLSNQKSDKPQDGHDDEVESEDFGQIGDERQVTSSEPVIDDSVAHMYSIRRVLEFRPRKTDVNEQYKVLSYTATEAKGFLLKMREIRQERLKGFISESNIDTRVADQIKEYQNEDHELIQQIFKEFLMPAS